MHQTYLRTVTAAAFLCGALACGPEDASDLASEQPAEVEVDTTARGLAAVGQGFAWVGSNGIVPPGYAFNSEGGSITAVRTGTGVYSVTFAGLGGGVNGGNVQVVSYGTTPDRCKVSGWGGSPNLTIYVRCHTAAGAAVNEAFVVQYARKSGSYYDQGAYLWAEQPTSSSYCPSPSYNWNSTGATNCITRSGVGVYQASLPGLTATGGAPRVTAYGADASHCKVQRWSSSGAGQSIWIRCFNTSGAPVDTKFALDYLASRHVGAYDMGGYAWTDDALSTGYPPSSTYAYNSGFINGWPGCNRYLGDVWAGRVAGYTGRYVLRYEWLPPYTNTAAHVTAYGADASYCKVEKWSAWGEGVEIKSRCFSASGSPVNTRYVNTYLTDRIRGPC